MELVVYSFWALRDEYPDEYSVCPLAQVSESLNFLVSCDNHKFCSNTKAKRKQRCHWFFAGAAFYETTGPCIQQQQTLPDRNHVHVLRAFSTN